VAPSLRFAVIAWALAATACLSTPPPAGGGDDDIDAPPSVSCRRDARPAGQAWPPAGEDLAIRNATIADIDADGIGDLVVNVAPRPPLTATASRIYVLYGPVSPTAPEWHSVLDLDDDAIDAEVQPLAVSLDDLDGDGCLDLTVAGTPTGNSQQDRAAVWRHGGGAVPWSGRAVTAPLDFDVTADGPVLVTWGDFGVGADRDLVVADLYNVHLLAGSTLDLLGNSTAIPFAPCASWDNVNAIVTAPGATRDRLLVFGHYRSNAVDLDDGGSFTVTGDCTNNTDLPQLRGYGVAALDLEAPADLLTGSAGDIGARVISGSAPIAVPSMGVRACAPTARGGMIEGITAGQLGGPATPDVVIIDHDPGDTPPGTFACLVSELSVDGDLVRKQSDDEVRITDGELRIVVIGDLGAGPRAWMFADDGTLHCRRRGDSNAVLVPC
jgi:hypothetical protein